MVKVLDRESINRMTRNSGRGGSTYVGGGGGGYTLPLAADGTRGGVQVGYTTDATARKYAVQLSGEKMFVNVPWTDHYSWGDITNKPAAAGGSTTPVYWTGSGFAQCTSYANASVSHADSAGSAETAGTANYANNGNIPFMLNGATDNLPRICWHIPNTNWCNIAMDSGGNLHLTSTNEKSNTYNKLYVGALQAYGTLTIATGAGIEDATGAGMLCYHPTGWTAVSNAQWGVGAIDCEGVIRSSNNALKHYRFNDGTYEIIDSKGGQTIANSLQIASVKIEQTNEVNSYQGALHLNYRVASDVTACIGGGNFGIGTTSPGHKLHVVGRIYCTGGFGFLSDIRKKDVITKDLHISVGDIAKAPLIRYTLKSDEKKEIHIGSVAQYWQNVMPETISKSNDGTLSMDYGTISLVSVVTLARKLETLEKELSDIKKELITK